MKKIFVLTVLIASSLVFVTTASAATLSISPSSQSVNVGDVFSVAVILDTQGASIDGVDGVDLLYLNYSPTLLEVQDASTTMAGIQITPGDLLSSTLANTVDSSLGRITFSQVSMDGNKYKGSGTLATISFKAIANGNANVTFDYTPGNTLDSNVASNGTDILSGVTNGSFVISTPTPTPAPVTAPPSSGGGGGSSGGGGGGGVTMYSLNTLFSGNGSGSIKSTPAGINCGKTNTSGCSSSFYANSTVLLTASPNASSSLALWTGCTSLVGTSTCSVTMFQAKSVTATFVPGKSTEAVTNTLVVTNPNVTNAMTVKTALKITRWLTVGSTGADVLQLQKALNQNGYIIATTGSGSPNNEASYFGPTTAVALGRFQCVKLQVCYGDPATTGYGSTGPKTRSALSQLFITSAPTTLSVVPNCPIGMVCTPIATGTSTYTQPGINYQLSTINSRFTRSLTMGSTGIDVKNLQVFLNTFIPTDLLLTSSQQIPPFRVAIQGSGSRGLETTYFGPATQRAVIKFQEYYKSEILTPSGLTSGTGYFGPATLRKINTLIK